MKAIPFHVAKLNLKKTLAGIRGEADFTDLLETIKAKARIVVQQDSIQ